MKLTHFLAAGLLLATACVERGSNNKDSETAYDRPAEDELATNEAGDVVDNEDIDENSFTNSPYFAEWDTNDDNQVDQNEFEENYFAMLDKDGDGTLNKEEWERAVKSFFGGEGELKYGELSAWDEDGNGQVSQQEFTAYLQEKDIYSEWAQGDEPLEEEAFAKGVFQNWDTDDNGVVEADEFTEQHNITGEGI